LKNTQKERYSFSKLSIFQTCKHAYHLRYNELKKGIGNCFSSYGTLLHSVLERHSRGEIDLWDLVDVYKNEFPKAVPEPFPNTAFCPDMRGLYFAQGIDFLENFGGYPEVKILEIESEFEYEVDNWMLNGVMDLVYEDKDGKLIIEDYKSKSSFKNKKEQAEYARQLYLYAPFIKQKYNRFPDTLRFVMLRKQKQIDIPFSQTSMNEAIEWAKKTVQGIRECFDFTPSPNEFFCNHLCNHRQTCEHKPQGEKV